MSDNPRILITRPLAEAKKFAAVLAENNFSPVLLPAIKIHPLDNNDAIRHAFATANKIIFVSRNAVKNVVEVAADLLKNYRGEILAVGATTAAELYALDIKEVIYPTEQFNSEALLELPELQDVVDSEIVIFAGVGGRELLAHSLVDRGASVTKIASYERHIPDYDVTTIKDALQNIDCIVSTSGENLRNLIQLTPEADRAKLFATPLLVISEAMVKIAEHNGFAADILVSANATDQAILERLQEWCQAK